MLQKLAIAMAGAATLALATPSIAQPWIETPEAKMEAARAADQARADMIAKWGHADLAPGKYLWDTDAARDGAARIVVSLDQQMAYLYRGDELVAVTTVSSGKPGKDTPPGIFPILEKKRMHHSRKYDNAPMPFMQRLTWDGVALHAGNLPGYPASHGCVRLPLAFAERLFTTTGIGSEREKRATAALQIVSISTHSSSDPS